MAQATQPDGAFPALDYDDPATWVVQPLMFDPGTQWVYGISIDWIGRLVQEIERPAARHLHAGRTSSRRSA